MSITDKAIATIRALAVDTVRKANSGHPGAAMGCAPIAYTLFTKFMKYSPGNPDWFNRDRFVLSNGHASALLYTMLHLCGFKISIEDLKQFRQYKSITPGHPERGVTPGVEVTTGPLGQGLSNAVGMAIAEANLEGTFNTEEQKIIDNYIYVICGDGCLMEGITSEASSLAGTLGLGHLIVLYDDNNISIDGKTDMQFTESVIKRYEAYGWHTQVVKNGDSDVNSIEEAIRCAKEDPRPSLIAVKTTIGYGSLKQGTSGVHGAPLTPEDIKQFKEHFGLDPEVSFQVPEEVQKHFREVIERNQQNYKEEQGKLEVYKEKNPQLYKELQRRLSGELCNIKPEELVKKIGESITIDTHNTFPTRKSSQLVLNAVHKIVPELIGGSADLTSSNLTNLEGETDFSVNNRAGHYIRFGVREHAMCAISNGISAYSDNKLLVPFDATFLTFAGYCVGAIRVGALSHLRAIHVFTHDSIGVGEDGPTHIPIETGAMLRATPNVLFIRPADTEETIGAYALALSRCTQSVLALSRQDTSCPIESCSEKVLRGAYIVRAGATGRNHKASIISTGTEVSLCVKAAMEYEQAHPEWSITVVSAPCLDVFIEQGQEYIHEVLGDGPVLSVEPYSCIGWSGRFSHAHHGIDSFALSAPAKAIAEHFKMTVDGVCTAMEDMLNNMDIEHVPTLSIYTELKLKK